MTINPHYSVPSILPIAFHCGWLRLIAAKYGTAFGPAAATAFSGIRIHMYHLVKGCLPRTLGGQSWSNLVKAQKTGPGSFDSIPAYGLPQPDNLKT
ncbi:MAG TPA: hypothetical protein VGE41_03605 [Verrucomicrobiae bacterium]